MNEPGKSAPSDPLFRQEAIDEYLRGREHGALLRVSPLWKHWAFGALVLTFAGAAAFAALAPIGVDVNAPAIMRASAARPGALEAACDVPLESRAALRAGQRVVVDFAGARRTQLVLELAAPPVADAPCVALVPDSLRARHPEIVPGWRGTAHVRVGEQTLLQALALQGTRP
jgi:hypothetical protein